MRSTFERNYTDEDFGTYSEEKVRSNYDSSMNVSTNQKERLSTTVLFALLAISAVGLLLLFVGAPLFLPSVPEDISNLDPKKGIGTDLAVGLADEILDSVQPEDEEDNKGLPDRNILGARIENSVEEKDKDQDSHDIILGNNASQLPKNNTDDLESIRNSIEQLSR